MPGQPRPGAHAHPPAGGRQSGLSLIWGHNPVLEALRGRRRVHTLLLARAADDRLEAALRSASPRPKVERLSAAELTQRTGSTDHQDVAALVDAYTYADPDDVLQSHTLLVALDEIHDPHNLGAVIRTAEAAGAAVVIPRHRTAQVTGAVVKASAGATEHAVVAMVRNLADFLTAAKEAGFWIYGAAANAEAAYTTQDYTYPTCFVMGSEGAGLGHRVASLCDVMVGLPLAGKVTSLNVSVSTGVLVYEAVRQRRAAGQGTEPPSGIEKERPATAQSRETRS